jgi:ABC-2 type transport system ATP-binding protein
MTAVPAARSIADAAATPIQARGLTKRYRERAAVDGVDLTVLPGEIYGFLGPNGAGKTTTMRMLLGLVRPDAGSISLYGRDPRADRLGALRGVAGIIEEPRLYPYLSGRANLRLLAAYDRSGTGAAAVEEVLETVELRDRAGDRVREYSQGMRQRLGLASCLVRRPRLLLLDEPANGLDPAGIRHLRGLLRRFAAEGITVFLSSHLLAEVDALCARVAIVTAGRIVYEGALDDLRRRSSRRYRLTTAQPQRALEVCRRIAGIGDAERREEDVDFAVTGDGALLDLARALSDAGIAIRALVPEQLTLERIFFELTERQPREAAIAA